MTDEQREARTIARAEIEDLLGVDVTKALLKNANSVAPILERWIKGVFPVSEDEIVRMRLHAEFD